MSQSAYNDTTAQLWYPKTREEVKSLGWQWKDSDQAEKYLGPVIELPDDIRDVGDDICEKILLSQGDHEPYKIIPQELKFYREHSIPLPRYRFAERHARRLHKRNPRQFWKRQCAKCGKGIETTYAPERPERVFCEECYLKTVY